MILSSDGLRFHDDEESCNTPFADRQAVKTAVCENYTVTVTTDVWHEDGDTVRVYGLCFSDGHGFSDCYDAITSDIRKISELFGYFQNYDVDRSQINDIVEDFVDALHFA